MRLTARVKGFTLIELLIVISIVIVLSAAILPSFSNYIENQAIKQEQENIRNDLRSIQNKALAGTAADETVGGDPVRYWGVKFSDGSNSYFSFVSDVDSGCTSVTEGSPNFKDKYSVSDEMIIEAVNAHACVYFNMSNGNITTVNIDDDDGDGNNDILVGDADEFDTTCKGVNLHSYGMIQNINSCP